MPLTWQFFNESGAPINPIKSADTLNAIANEALSVLIVLTEGHDDIPKALSKESAVLLRALKTVPIDTSNMIMNLLVAIYRGKKDFLLETPKSVFNTFGVLMRDQPHSIPIALHFMKNQMIEVDETDTAYEKLVEEDNISRNQILVFRAIQSAMTNTTNPYKINYTMLKSKEQLIEYIELVDVLSLASRQNTIVGGAAMHRLMPWETVAKVIKSVLDASAESLDLGIGVQGLDDPHLRKLLRRDLLRSHVDLFYRVNMNEKAFDESIVLSRMCYLLTRSIALSTKSDCEDAISLLQIANASNISKKQSSSTTESSLFGFSTKGGGIEMSSKDRSNSKKRTRSSTTDDTMAQELELSTQNLLYSKLGYLQAYLLIEKGQHADIAGFLVESCALLSTAPPLASHSKEEDSHTYLSPSEKLAFEASTMAQASCRRAWKILEDQFPERFEVLNAERERRETFRPGDAKAAAAIEDGELSSVSSASTHAEALSLMAKLEYDEATLTEQLKAFVEYVSTLPLVKDKIEEEEEGIIHSLTTSHLQTDPNQIEYVEGRLKTERLVQLGLKSRRRLSLNSFGLGAASSSAAGGGGGGGGSYAAAVENPVIDETEIRTNKVNFQDLVKRMVRHIDSKIESGLPHTVSKDLIDILCRYIEDGEDIDDDQEKKAAAGVVITGGVEMTKRQKELNSYGVTNLIYRIIAAHDASADEEIIFAKALRLGSLLLENGERSCQNQLLLYAETHDSDGKFFSNLRGELITAITWIDETRFNPDMPEEDQDDLSDDEAEDQRDTIFVLRFLQLMCEVSYENEYRYLSIILTNYLTNYLTN